MAYDLYFHNDFDGVTSASLMADFLEKKGEKIGNYFAVDHSSFNKNRWLKMKFKNPAVIVDFLYHPDAAFWFDHHSTTFVKEEWRQKFKPSYYHQWNTKYLSAYHLVFDSLAKNFDYQPSRYFYELTKWADIVDGARYDSAEQTIKSKEPFLQINAFIEQNADQTAALIPLIKILGKQSLLYIARRQEIQNAVNNFRKKANAALKFYKQNFRIYDKVGFWDLSPNKIMEMPFAPFYLRPQLAYRLLLKKNKRKLCLSVSYNPWLKKKNKIDIGKLLREKCGGGGHYNAGGVSDIRNIREAQKIVGEIMEILNKNDS